MNKKLALILLVALFASCAKNAPNAEVEAAKRAVEANPADASSKERLVKAYLLEAGDPQSAIDIYEADESLRGRMMSEIYYATALCMKAGETKTDEQKMRFVRKGISAFDALVETYSDDPHPFMWQAATYSNFPAVLAADELVCESIETCEALNDKAKSLDAGDLKQLVFAYCNIAKEFKNIQYAEKAEEAARRHGLSDDAECAAAIKSAKKKAR